MPRTPRRFSLGTTYRPPGDPFGCGGDPVTSAAGADLAHVAALGLDTVRLPLRWDALQPRPDEVDGIVLERVAEFIDLAAAHALGVVLVPFGDVAFRSVALPRWAVDPRVTAEVAVVTGDAIVAGGAGDLYTGPLLGAQVALLERVSARLGAHPALRAWEIGTGVTRVRRPRRGKRSAGEHSPEPAAERDLAAWARALATALRAGPTRTDGTRPETLVTIDGAELRDDRELRLGSLAAALDLVGLADAGVDDAFARGRLDPETTPFLAALAAGFSGKDVLVTALGSPGCPPGTFSAFESTAAERAPDAIVVAPDDPVFAPFTCLTDDEQARTAGAALDRLHRDGRRGALWRAWSDVDPAFARTAPYDRAPGELRCGLVTADGVEKPVARAVAAFARERRDVVTADEMPLIGSNYYYRTIPESTATLYDAFLRFVADRRVG